MKISVVTVCYNAAATIAQTLASVAAQDWPDFEHIVIDGASRDATLGIIDAHRHPRLRVVSEADAGIYDAMNKGLALATGDYIAFLNADDLYARPDALRLVAEAALARRTDCILGDTQFMSNSGSNVWARHYSAKHFARWWLRCGIMPPHPSLFARRELLVAAGGFDTSFSIAADFDLIAKIVLQHGATWHSIGKTITLFRTGGISTSAPHVQRTLSDEMSKSLKTLGVNFSTLSVLLRYPIKILQYWPSREARALDQRSAAPAVANRAG